MRHPTKTKPKTATKQNKNQKSQKQKAPIKLGETCSTVNSALNSLEVKHRTLIPVTTRTKMAAIKGLRPVTPINNNHPADELSGKPNSRNAHNQRYNKQIQGSQDKLPSEVIPSRNV